MTKRTIQAAVVTGPTGAIGSALCRTLTEAGVMVYAVCRPGSRRTENLPKNSRIQIVECDAGDLLSLKQKIERKIDTFYHFAWADTIGPGRNDMVSQTRNICYTIYAVQAAASLGCGVFIGSGSQAEYGRVEGSLKPETPCFPENGYGMAKLCAGQMSRVECAKWGLDFIWARVLSVYGPHDGPNTMVSSVIRQLLAGQEPALTAGEQQWDYLYADDAAAAFYAMAQAGRNGAVYPVGGGKALPLRSYIETMRDIINPALPLGFGQIAYPPRQVMRLQADISALQQDTGFVPRVSFQDGIRATIEAIQKEVNNCHAKT